MPAAARLLRQARASTGQSQRQLAQRAGTSHATISSYEAGRKDPRTETLDRLLRSLGAELDSRPARSANQIRTDLLCRAFAERVLADPSILVTARERLWQLRRLARSSGASYWLDAWDHLLAAGPEAVAGVLTSTAEAARPLKSTTPLAGIGLLSPRERAILLDGADRLARAHSGTRA